MSDVDRSRLYGLPGAMHLHAALNDAIEEAWDVTDKDGTPPVIEEFTVHEPQYHLPSAGSLAEHCADIADESETDEDAAEEFRIASEDPDVLAALQAAIDVMASKVNYRMSNELVAIWHPPAGDGEWQRKEPVALAGASTETET